jgi:hypothetical protein
MSTRGGYGFVLNGKETIVYTGNGTDLEGLGNLLIEWLKEADLAKTSALLTSLEPKDGFSDVSPEDINAVANRTGVTPISRYGKEINSWNDLMYLGQFDPDFLLSSGYFIDGSWILSSCDLEYFYLNDLDKNRLEIYHGYSHAGEVKGRFGKGIVLTGTETDQQPPTLLAMYSLDALPENLNYLEENQYDLRPWRWSKKTSFYDVSGDPTFIHSDNY